MDTESELYAAIGRGIRSAREHMVPRMSQATLADKVGMNRVSIVNIESGKQRAPVHLLWNISSALGMELCDLIPRSSELEVSVDSTNLDRRFVKEIEKLSQGDQSMKGRLTSTVLQLSTDIGGGAAKTSVS